MRTVPCGRRCGVEEAGAHAQYPLMAGHLTLAPPHAARVRAGCVRRITNHGRPSNRVWPQLYTSAGGWSSVRRSAPHAHEVQQYAAATSPLSPPPAMLAHDDESRTSADFPPVARAASA